MSHKKTAADRAITAQRIASLIGMAGLSQSEVARRCKVVRNNVYRWCSGRAEPDASAYLDLFEALRGDVPGLTLDALLGRDQHALNKLQDRAEAAQLRAEHLEKS